MPLIRCKLHRPGGTRITFGVGKARVDYHFKPEDPAAKLDDDRVDHVCDVTNPDHAAHLVTNIKEGYELVEGDAPAPKAVSKSKAAEKSSKKAAGEPPVNKEIAKMNKAELLAAVAAKQGGKAPHPSTSAAKLREILLADEQ